jgi:hypothetical protein
MKKKIIHYVLLCENKWMFTQQILKSASRRSKKLVKEIVLSHVFFLKLNLVLGIYSKSYIKNIKY